MRQLAGKIGWWLMKWSFKLITHEQDSIYAYVPLPPGFHFDEVTDVNQDGFMAKAVKLTRDGVVIPPGPSVAAGAQGYF